MGLIFNRRKRVGGASVNVSGTGASVSKRMGRLTLNSRGRGSIRLGKRLPHQVLREDEGMSEQAGPWPTVAYSNDPAGMVIEAVAEEFGWTNPDTASGEAYEALGLFGIVPDPQNCRTIVRWLRDNVH